MTALDGFRPFAGPTLDVSTLPPAPPLRPDADLLRATLTHIKAHPEEWDQAVWVCGTIACFAGHAAMLAGGEVAEYAGACIRLTEDEMNSGAFRPDEKEGEWVQPHSKGGALVSISHYARVKLGLTHTQAKLLFLGSNSVHALGRFVEHFIAAAEPEEVSA